MAGIIYSWKSSVRTGTEGEAQPASRLHDQGWAYCHTFQGCLWAPSSGYFILFCLIMLGTHYPLKQLTVHVAISGNICQKMSSPSPNSPRRSLGASRTAQQPRTLSNDELAAVIQRLKVLAGEARASRIPTSTANPLQPLRVLGPRHISQWRCRHGRVLGREPRCGRRHCVRPTSRRARTSIPPQCLFLLLPVASHNALLPAAR